SVILKKHPLKKLSEKEDYLKNLILKIKNIEQKLKIDDKHKELFKAMREGIHLKELRKTFVSQSLYYYDSILKEIARRGGITLKEARHIKTEEVIKLLKEKNMKEELSERVKLSVFLVKKGKTKILIGKKAALMYEDLCLAKGDINELKGFSAAPGFARGPVQIIMHPTEIDKIKKGVILVTAQIVPSFGPALKKIAGLVCDGGTGITSHPAILAREAGIPAVTSTNVATQVLKDGDLVEVDGYKGIVKKL
ncbi:MAG: hypothetical protein KKF89_05105, partial [Nanoarchaeota archaeon]|nr:hypothetical protein [Nanoarchaeota archaeon]